MNENAKLERPSEPKSHLAIEKTGLYTPFPVLAYRVLIAAKEHVAKDVLICLVSHLGRAQVDNSSRPSYSTIARETGRSRSSIASGIRTLEEFGFVKTWRGVNSKTKKRKNIYYIQSGCYQANKMKKVANDYLPIVGRCGCGAAVRMGEFGVGNKARHHYSCGSKVKFLRSRTKLTDRETESRGLA